MSDEIAHLLDVAVKKEMESKAVYESAQAKVTGTVAKRLLKALAEEEAGHVDRVRHLAEKNNDMKFWDEEKVKVLQGSDLVNKEDVPLREGADTQEILRYAIQREADSIGLYTKIQDALRDKDARKLCHDLLQEERGHKIKLENMYRDLYYG